MNRITAIVVVGFILAFAAGGSVGMLAGPEPPEPSPPPQPPQPLKKLHLTPEQKEQMRRIWSGVFPGPGGPGRPEEWTLHQQYRQAMEQFLAGLRPDQRQQYKRIQEDFRRGMEELMCRRRQRVEEAVLRTREILTPDQARLYEEMRRRGRRRMHGPGSPPGGPNHPGRPGGPGPWRGGRLSPGPFRGPGGPPAAAPRAVPGRGRWAPRGRIGTQPSQEQ